MQVKNSLRTQSTDTWEKRNTWKLVKLGSQLPERMYDNLEITIKRAGSDAWTSVEFGHTFHGRTSERWMDGDQLNVRYVRGGQSLPVSFDGTDANNIFPVTFHAIG